MSDATFNEALDLYKSTVERFRNYMTKQNVNR